MSTRVLLICTLLAAVPMGASPLELKLPEWWKAAEEAAAKVPEADRKPFERELIQTDFDEQREAGVRAMLVAIALRPQDVRGPLNVLRYASRTEGDHAVALAFVENLYRSHSGTDSATALLWQSGRAELLLDLGRWEEALPLQRALVAAHDADAYDRILLAVLEKVNGNDEPFAKIVTDCPAGDDPETESENPCWTIARSIANRVVTNFGPHAPAALTDILAGRTAAPKQSWQERMHGLTTLAFRAFEKAKPELEAVLADKDAPDFAQDDALYLMIYQLSALPSAELLAMTDCWLARRGAEFPQMTVEGWEQLRPLFTVEPKKEDEEPSPHRQCLEHDHNARVPLDLHVPCVEAVLSGRAMAATNLRDDATQRETVERMAALSLERGYATGLLAYELENAADRAGVTPDLRALQYVASLTARQPWRERTMNALRQQTQRVTSPWDSPVTVPSHVTPDCTARWAVQSPQ